jgi:integrase
VKTSFEPTSVQHLYRREPIMVYYARIYSDGGSKWVSLKTKVFAVAKFKLANLKIQTFSAPKTDKLIRTGAATMGELAKAYLRSVELDGGIKASSKEYRVKTVLYLLRSWPELEHLPPSKVTGENCQEWGNRYRESFSETLYNNTLDSLRHIFALAVKRGLIVHNPALSVSKVKVRQKKLELPSSAQFHAIVAAVRDAGSATSQGCGDLVEFLCYSGCRVSEAAGVRWQDVDYDRGRIYIAPGKNSEDRFIPLTPAMNDLLARIQVMPRWFRAQHRHDAGCIVSVAECQAALTAACAKVGAARMTHHTLRHLFATRCIEAGVDIPTVATWLGHVDKGALLMKIYSHLLAAHSQDMARKVAF